MEGEGGLHGKDRALRMGQLVLTEQYQTLQCQDLKTVKRIMSAVKSSKSSLAVSFNSWGTNKNLD